MGSRICNQKNRGYDETKQDHEASGSRGYIGDRSRNLAKLIGVERVSQRNFQYEGTYYVTEDGETYEKEYVDTHKPRRTGINFYEVSNWIYNERKQMYEPIVRRIVIIKNTNIQLSLNYE
nr:MAG TPA: hypothetical protein [Microviridae sp.]